MSLKKVPVQKQTIKDKKPKKIAEYFKKKKKIAGIGIFLRNLKICLLY